MSYTTEKVTHQNLRILISAKPKSQVYPVNEDDIQSTLQMKGLPFSHVKLVLQSSACSTFVADLEKYEKRKETVGFGPTLHQRLAVEPKEEAKTEVASATAVKDRDETMESWSPGVPKGVPFKNHGELEKAQEMVALDPVQATREHLDNYSNANVSAFKVNALTETVDVLVSHKLNIEGWHSIKVISDEELLKNNPYATSIDDDL